MSKVILSANTDWYLYNFRLSMAQAIQHEGVEVLLLSPLGQYVSKIQNSGLRWSGLHMDQHGLNPISELALLAEILSVYQRERPDLVHHFTVKPILYGSLAAKLLGIPAVVNSVTGLGYVFVNPGRIARVLRPVVLLGYRYAMSGRGSHAIFQNNVHRNLFIERKIVAPEKSSVILGSGIDTAHFTPKGEPPGKPLIIMPSRMLFDKGVEDLVRAARLLHQAKISATVALVGDTDIGNPAAIPAEQLHAWETEGVIEWWGYREDMLEVLTKCHIVTLPSYGEGVPKALIEAAACGKPIVATDVPGCREVVRHEVNGLLVPARDPEALSNALARLVGDRDLRARMGEQGRRLALKKFSNDHVNDQTLSIYRKLLPGEWPSGPGSGRKDDLK
ncbi:MAG: glycosyltransferase family 4 protein [Chloroflexi bacterium]|nr:glycosyltransferase family 4 protein [Chloroflexota bacterium]